MLSFFYQSMNIRASVHILVEGNAILWEVEKEVAYMTQVKNLDNLKMTIQMMQTPRIGWRYAARSCASSKMSNAMINICIVIVEKPGISQDGVAKDLKMDKSSVAKIVMKAVKEGYITRQVNQEDHREYQLYITSLGEESVDCFLKALEAWQNDVLQILSETERQEFAELYDKIYQEAKKIGKEY